MDSRTQEDTANARGMNDGGMTADAGKQDREEASRGCWGGLGWRGRGGGGRREGVVRTVELSQFASTGALSLWSLASASRATQPASHERKLRASGQEQEDHWLSAAFHSEVLPVGLLTRARRTSSSIGGLACPAALYEASLRMYLNVLYKYQ
ncbi:hypothetical protein BDZ91DRAFT_764919 [Kalaharituber pfeilii]|nr:hypothetical protein BDZ91DRAFT_764919 [Kalaharituber pfeilii]